MRRALISVLIIGTFFSNVFAQSGKIRIDADKTPLKQVLFHLRDKYGFQFSFDDNALSVCYVSVHREFDSKEKAISFLLSEFPLKYEKSGDVFVIIPSASGKRASGKTTNISGQVVETATFEPLPFSYITINKRQVQAGKNGDFTFLASADSTYHLQISHLGYFVYDTLLSTSLNKRFLLTPSVKELGEVKVEGYTVEKSTLIGDQAGKMKINSTIAPYLPGNGDNSVYTVLRLMPGVLAAGEQSSDLLIRGSYESQTKIEFDGITIFGLNNQNDNIGVVNPLLIKDMQVLKGGYDANYDDRVGGIVQISGKDGIGYRPAFTFNINNTTVNALGEIPVGKKSSVLAAYRQTYYNLYNPFNFNLFGGSQMESSMGTSTGMGSSNNGMTDVLVIPDYKFRDANFKYSWKGDNNDVLTIGFYGGGDRFQYHLDGLSGYQDLQNNLTETNFQSGGSASYFRPWGGIVTSNISLSYSGVKNQYEEFNSYAMEQHNMQDMQSHHQNLKISDNKVRELNLEENNRVSLKNGFQLNAGIGYQQNDLQLTSKLNGENQISVANNSGKFNFWFQGHFPVGNRLNINTGLRGGYENLTKNYYFDPRISASLCLSKTMKFNAAWGKYL
jgi:hypothetical protein